MRAYTPMTNTPTIYLASVRETDSTMRLIKSAPYTCRDEDLVVVVADAQTQGRGQRGNSWESEPGRNLTFSIRVRPTWLEASRQFALSEAVALAIRSTLETFTPAPADGIFPFSVKWPNDIYWTEKKISGILIEHRLSGQYIAESIIGIGLNVNQQKFVSDAPNPVSLSQICGKVFDLGDILRTLIENFCEHYDHLRCGGYDTLHTEYLASLYRRVGAHRFRDNLRNEIICASIADVAPDGRLTLRLDDNTLRHYLFKEVSFLHE